MTDAEREAELAELRNKKALLEQLGGHGGWLILLEIMQAQVVARRRMEFERALQSLDDCFKSATARGEVGGIQLWPSMLEQVRIDIQERLRALTDELREGE